MADEIAHQFSVIEGDEMGGIDDAGDQRRVAVDCRDDIVEPVRGRVEAFERAAAVCPFVGGDDGDERTNRSEEHTSELQSLMRISYAVFCLKKKKKKTNSKTI